MNANRTPLAIRTHPLVFGTILFLASDLMLFGGLLASYYYLRNISSVWPPSGIHLDRQPGYIGTLLLAVSSFSMWRASSAFERQRYPWTRFWIGVTIVLGSAFLLLTYHDWMTNTFKVDTNAYSSLYYVITGVHACHVFAGLVLLSTFFFGVKMPAFGRDRRAGAQAIGLYWHFVFAVWLFIWGTLYFV